MNKENETPDKKQNGNGFIADVSKSLLIDVLKRYERLKINIMGKQNKTKSMNKPIKKRKVSHIDEDFDQLLKYGSGLKNIPGSGNTAFGYTKKPLKYFPIGSNNK